MARVRHRALVSCTLGLALLGAAPAGAATPAGTAKQAANTAVNAALASFKTAEKQARTAFDADLADFEATLASPADPVLVGASLALAISALQSALTAGLDAALDQAANAHADAMAAFQTATGGSEPFPRDLLAGGGGAADRLRDGLRAAAAKSIAKARKRLARTIQVVRAADVRTVIRLEPPRTTHEQGPNPAGTVEFGDTPLTIDLLIGLGAVGANGGFVVAGGQGEPGLGQIALLLDGSDGQSGTTFPDDPTQRWAFTFGSVDLVDLGGEVLVVRQSAGAAAAAAIGVP